MKKKDLVESRETSLMESPSAPRRWAHGPLPGPIGGKVLMTPVETIAPTDHNAPIARILAIGRYNRTHEMQRLSGIATGAVMTRGTVTLVAMTPTAGTIHGTTEAVVTLEMIDEITPMIDRL